MTVPAETEAESFKLVLVESKLFELNKGFYHEQIITIPCFKYEPFKK